MKTSLTRLNVSTGPSKNRKRQKTTTEPALPLNIQDGLGVVDLYRITNHTLASLRTVTDSLGSASLGTDERVGNSACQRNNLPPIEVRSFDLTPNHNDRFMFIQQWHVVLEDPFSCANRTTRATDLLRMVRSRYHETNCDQG